MTQKGGKFVNKWEIFRTCLVMRAMAEVLAIHAQVAEDAARGDEIK